MRHIGSAVTAALIACGVIAAVAAANVHFVGQPKVTDNGTSLTLSGKIAGLGNEDVTIVARATARATVICKNPAGHTVPGQNKPNLTVSRTETISADEIKNGNVTFSLTTAKPPRLTAKQAGCPNNSWTAVITDLEFIRATVTVFQGGEQVLQRTFTF
jgi:hypothetical protein